MRATGSYSNGDILAKDHREGRWYSFRLSPADWREVKDLESRDGGKVAFLAAVNRNKGSRE